MLINTAGGITGGDCFDVAAEVGPGAALTLTTQAAERAYRATGDSRGRLTTRLRVAAGGHVSWLPQETILYDGSALERRLTIDIALGASCLLVEPLVFGRAAMGETLRDGWFRDRITVTRGGAPLFEDRTLLTGDIAAHLARPHVAAGAGAMALAVFVGAEAEAHLEPLRAALPATCGVSLIGADVLVMRLLAADGFTLRRVLVPALIRLARTDLPRCWSL